MTVLPCAGIARPKVSTRSSEPRRPAPAAGAPIPVPVGLPAVEIVLEHVPYLGVEEAIR